MFYTATVSVCMQAKLSNDSCLSMSNCTIRLKQPHYSGFTGKHNKAADPFGLCAGQNVLLLQVFTNTAAALPCELGPDDDAAGRGSAAAGESSSQPGSNRRPFLDWLPASKYQLAWAQRVNAAKQQ